MSSNSKLTSKQKNYRKGLIKYFRDTFHDFEIAQYEGVTVAKFSEFPGARMARVAFSFASPDEQKIRRKVGEYHALMRLYREEYVMLPNNLSAQEFAEILSEYTYI